MRISIQWQNERFIWQFVPGITTCSQGLRSRKGNEFWVYHKTSQQNEKFRWVEALVVEAASHGLKFRRTKKVPQMAAAYEHVRISPKGKLASELFERLLEGELYDSTNIEDDDAVEEKTSNEPSNIQESDKNIRMEQHDDWHERLDTVNDGEASDVPVNAESAIMADRHNAD